MPERRTKRRGLRGTGNWWSFSRKRKEEKGVAPPPIVSFSFTFTGTNAYTTSVRAKDEDDPDAVAGIVTERHTGTYRIEGDRLTTYDESGKEECAYTMEIQGDRLTLKLPGGVLKLTRKDRESVPKSVEPRPGH